MLLIPRVFHQIWVGDNPLPKRYQDFSRGLLEDNPGWSLRVWNEGLIASHGWGRKHHKKRKSGLGSFSNAIRYEIISHYGGVYVDVDVESVRPIEPILDEIEAFCGWEIDCYLMNGAIFGAIPHHPWVRDLVNTVDAWTFRRRAWGPTHVTQQTRNRLDVKVFESDVFYPYCWCRGDGLFTMPAPTTVLFHHGDETWNEKKDKTLTPSIRPLR